MGRELVDHYTMSPSINDILNDDVLGEIFHLFVNCRNASRLRSPRKREGPLLLSHVCRRWRSVALDSPMLWSTLAIEYHSPYDLVEHYLSLSREASLTLLISYWTYECNDHDERMLDLLLSRVHRWRSVHTFINEDTARHLLNRIDPVLSSTSILEEAIIEGPCCVTPQTSHQLLSHFLNHFPHLTRLHWRLDPIYTYPSFNPSWSVPESAWNRITHLTIASPDLVFIFLQHCSNLEYLTLDLTNAVGLSLHRDLGASSSSLKSSSLRKLIVRVDEPRRRLEVAQFISSIHCICEKGPKSGSTHFVMEVRPWCTLD